MSDIITTDANGILENFQNAYYNQIGSRMQIGSEEYTLSSIFTYVLSIYSVLINQSYKNQNLDTASGEFLDNIAAKYNLSRTPDTYSNPWFEGYFAFNSNTEIFERTVLAGEFEVSIGGHTYKNRNQFLARYNAMIRFDCTEKHSDYLTATEITNQLNALTDGNGSKIFQTIEYFNVTPLVSVAAPLDDEAFREYIRNSKRLYIPGVAGSFEALAKICSPNILDAHVIRQSEDGFRTGAVQIKIKPWNKPPTVVSTYINRLVEEIDIPALRDIIEQLNFTILGQQVTVGLAEAITDTRYYEFYVPKGAESDLYNYKFKIVEAYLNKYKLKIAESYIPSDLVRLMMMDLTGTIKSPEDLGFGETSNEYLNFDKCLSLTVLGVRNIPNQSTMTPSSHQYVQLRNNTAHFTEL